MKISIIIPTYNEEDYLPALLKSIQRQNFKDLEVIVADAHSTDKTLEIAKKYNCKIVPGGLPAVGRNNGAKIAQGELSYKVVVKTAESGDQSYALQITRARNISSETNPDAPGVTKVLTDEATISAEEANLLKML